MVYKLFPTCLASCMPIVKFVPGLPVMEKIYIPKPKRGWSVSASKLDVEKLGRKNLSLGQGLSLFGKVFLQRFKIPEKGIYGTNSKSLAKPGTQDRRLFWKVFSKTARQISNPSPYSCKKGFYSNALWQGSMRARWERACRP